MGGMRASAASAVLVLLFAAFVAAQDRSGCRQIYLVQDTSLENVPAFGVASKSITVPESVVITDVNVIAWTGTTARVDALEFRVTSPAGTTARLVSRPALTAGVGGVCNTGGYSFSLDDSAFLAVDSNGNCRLSEGTTVRPSGDPLSVFLGENTIGEWVFEVESSSASTSTFTAVGVQFNCHCHHTYSSTASFTVPASGSVSNIIAVPDEGSVSDFSLNLVVSTSSVQDLQVELSVPWNFLANTEEVFNGVCATGTGLSASFNDFLTEQICVVGGPTESSQGRSWGTSTGQALGLQRDSMIFIPWRFSAVNRLAGDWELTVTSSGAASATVRSWSVTTCMEEASCQVITEQLDSSTIFGTNTMLTLSDPSLPMRIRSLKVIETGATFSTEVFDGAVGGSEHTWTYNGAGASMMLYDAASTTVPIFCLDSNTVQRWSIVYDMNAKATRALCEGSPPMSVRPHESLDGLNLGQPEFPLQIALSSMDPSTLEAVSFAINCDACWGMYPSRQHHVDFGPGSAEVAVDVPVDGVVRDISLTLSIETDGATLSDLEVWLKPPVGAAQRVLYFPFTDCSSAGNMLLVTTLKDDALFPLTALGGGSCPPSLMAGTTFRPHENLTLFEPLLGGRARGQWTIRVRGAPMSTLGAGVIYRAILGLCVVDECPARSTNWASMLTVPPFATQSSPLRMAVPPHDRIYDVAVQGVVVDSPATSDLTLTLVSPAGTRVPLVSPTCDTASESVQLSFHDRAFAPEDCAVDASITVQPAGALSTLHGERIAGTWLLEVANGGTDEAEVRYWGLRFNCDCNEMLMAARAPGQFGALSVPPFPQSAHQDVFALAADLHLFGNVERTGAQLTAEDSTPLHTFLDLGLSCTRPIDDTNVDLIADSALPTALGSQRLAGQVAADPGLPCPAHSGLPVGSTDGESSRFLAPLSEGMVVETPSAISADAITVSACTSRCMSYSSFETAVLDTNMNIFDYQVLPLYVTEPIQSVAIQSGLHPITVSIDSSGDADAVQFSLITPAGDICTLYSDADALAADPLVFSLAPPDPDSVPASSDLPGLNVTLVPLVPCDLGGTFVAEGLWQLHAISLNPSPRVTVHGWTLTIGCEQCVDWRGTQCAEREACTPHAFQHDAGGLAIPPVGTVAHSNVTGQNQLQNRTINAVHVNLVHGAHDNFGELSATLVHEESGTRVELFSGVCAGQSGVYGLAFSDEAPLRSIRCPAQSGTTFRPSEPLSALRGLSASTEWSLEMTDSAGMANEGRLDRWGLHVCEGNPELQLFGGSALSVKFDHMPSAGAATYTLDANDFGKLPLFGASSLRRFRITNDGDGAVLLDDVALLSSGTVFVFTEVPDFPLVLNPLESVELEIRFDPVMAVVSIAQLRITHTDVQEPSPFSIYLRGEGVEQILEVLDDSGNPITSPLTPSVSDGTNFGVVNVGDTADSEFALVNLGGADITDLSVSGLSAPFSIEGVPPGASLCAMVCSTPLRIRFAPTTDTAYSDVLEITYTGASGPVQYRLAFSGVGGQPGIVVSGGGLNIANNEATPVTIKGTLFDNQGLVGMSQTNSFVVTNGGLAPLNIVVIRIEDNTADFSVSNTFASVAPGASMTFQVTFDPSGGSCNLRQATVEIQSNASPSPFRFIVAGGIEDNVGPIISPNMDVFATASNGACFGRAVIPEPSATDACSGVKSITADPPEYWTRTFGVGETVITITAVDGLDNVAVQTITVRVDDPDPPAMTCPQSQVTTSCRPRVFYLEPLAVDNCGATVQQTSGRPSGSAFPVGVTTNRFEATDGSGLTSDCVFTVTVIAEDDCTEKLSTVDADGDGFSPADGDTCETRDQCEFPYLVNPGAIEIPNGFDDNGNGLIDDLGLCSLRNSQLDVASSQQLLEHVPRALGLCSRYDDAYDRRYGYSWKRQRHPYLSLADGTTIESPDVVQSAVLTHYAGIQSADASMLMLSTGAARDANDPDYFDTSMDMGTVTPPPYEWVHAQPGGKLPYAPVCGDQPTQDPDVLVYDGVRFRMTMRQPTNMRGFALDVLFGTQQPSGRYPATDLCDPRQDFALVLTNAKGSPRDRNIARDASGAPFSSLNSAVDFWDICTDFSDIGHCRLGGYRLRGSEFRGATDWHTVGCNAEPGAEFWLDVGVFDGGSPDFDSFVLADRLRFAVEERTAATYGQQPVSNIRLSRVRAVPPTLRGGETTVTVIYSITNTGPDPAGDIFLTFHPVDGVTLTAIEGDIAGPCSWLPEHAHPATYSVMYRCGGGARLSIPSGGGAQGSLTFQVEKSAGGIVPFAFVASTSSVDDNLNDNYARLTVRQ